ncbi:MAG TPA: IclR family transcriptional regulator [Candidatus Binatia bacterium]
MLSAKPRITEAKKQSAQANGSLTVLFALDVLEIVSSKGSAGITEIAKLLSSDKSRVVRVIKSLTSRGYVARDEASRRYRVGPKVAELFEASRQNSRLEIIARPILHELREAFQGTAVLRVFDGYHMVTVASEESATILRICHHVGARYPLTIGAHSRVFAAFLPEPLVRRLLKKQKDAIYTNKKVLDIDGLIRDLRRVRKQGYGFSDEDIARGVRTIAAPVRDVTGDVIATMGISLPSFALPKTRIEPAAKVIKAAARAVSRELGWSETKE